MKGNPIEIASQKSSPLSEFREIIAYKDLLFFLVLRDIKVLYKQTVLGLGWAIFQPLVTMVLFTIFFGKLAGLENQIKDGVPYAVFTYVALIPWMYISSALNASSNSLLGNSMFITKIYFPRIIIPLTPVIAKLLDFFIALVTLVIIFFFYDVIPSMNRIIYLPVFILMMMLTAIGGGMWLSALSVQYRDIRLLLPLATQILLFVSPIIWPISIIPEKYHELYSFNPLVGILEGFRESIIGTDQIPWNFVMRGYLTSLILAVSGYFYFKHKEKIFADVV